ncbi:MAG TPA: hypothetical protein VJ842_14325 [Pyrinomonadaceae bacterium]|nr:hypothetical protein [Pyrinomonadaceae bacterium]
MPLEGYLSGPLLEKIADLLTQGVGYLEKFVRDDQSLRVSQAANAPLAQGFQQGTIIDTALTVFTDAQGTRAYSFLIVLLEDTAGACRYTVDATQPTNTRGHKAPAGGTVIEIPGAQNIKNFKIIAEAGASAAFTMQGFI